MKRVIPVWSNLSKTKKIAVIVILIILLGIGLTVGKGKNSSSSLAGSTTSQSVSSISPATSPDEIASLKAKVDKSLTYDIVNSDPDAYKGKVIQWGGKVFVEPEKDLNGVYLQVYAGDNDKNFIVAYAVPSFEVKRDDYISVIGVVKGKFSGENGFGAKIDVPQITAGYIEKGTRSSVLEPASKTVNVNKPIIQNAFTVTLDKIELAANETRFFLKVSNKSGGAVNFYTYGAKAVIGTTQLEAKSQYGSGEELPSEVKDGVEATGVLVFPAMKPGQNVRLLLDKPYSSSNYNLNWQEVNFDASI